MWTSFGGVPGQETLTLSVTWPGGWPIRGGWTSYASSLLITGNCSHRAGSPLTARHQMEVLRLKADLGDDHARQILVR
jgi:hypothetical protein